MSDLVIAGYNIAKGERKKFFIETAPFYDFTTANIPVEVIRGKKDGPVLFVSAAIHGDEINGVKIIINLLKNKRLKSLKGTLIVVPILNTFGFNTKSRYLPDRRDLNRCFPGNEGGSMASQLAYLFTKEIVSKCTHGIDIHTGAIHRTNLPQIRACLKDPQTKKLAGIFGAPVVINSDLRDGSLREMARELNIPILLYEAGEALRFHKQATHIGVRGILHVMEAIGMLHCKNGVCEYPNVYYAKSSHWLRSSNSGILHTKYKVGDSVKAGDILGYTTDPFGDNSHSIIATHSGIIVGQSMIPLLNRGEAVFHVATFEDINNINEMADSLETENITS